MFRSIGRWWASTPTLRAVLVDADVIDDELLREDGVIDFATPASAKGEVDQKVLRLAEGVYSFFVGLVGFSASIARTRIFSVLDATS